MHPTQVGPYVIEKRLGAGGMGTVYLGRHETTGLLAAVKVLPASLAREEGFVARFNREIDAMKRLSNPHVVQLFDSGVDNETYYYAMEYVEGETLTSRLLREKRIAWREAVEIALQICVALKSAHDAGIIHRDLKPSNLLLASDGMVKLTDFGVAQVFAGGKLTATGGIIGTAEYMSPEQAQGTRATKKSDLYSLGAVLYAMITGRPPFTGKTTLEVIQKHRHAQFDRPSRYVPEIPRWLDDITCQLLEKEPDKRFPDAYVLSRRIQESLRKSEFAVSAETLTGPITSAATRVGHEGDAPHGEGPGVATLMRDLVQHEIRESQKQSPIASFFDNIWVLTICLLLVVGGGVVWFRSRELSPDQKFAAGVAILEQPESEEWIRARNDYFQPLVEADTDSWSERVQPYLDRIEAYDRNQRLLGRRPSRTRVMPQSEAERFLHQARSAQENGDWPKAERILDSLVVLLRSDPAQKNLLPIAENLLTEVRTASRAATDTTSLADEAVRRAEALRGEGHAEEAAALCRAVVTLYDGDPNAAAAVDKARSMLKSE